MVQTEYTKIIFNSSITTINALQEQRKSSTMSPNNGIASLNDMIKDEKKRLIEKVHLGKKGEPLTIKQVPDDKGVTVWKTRINGKDFTSRDEERFYDKLLEHYSEVINGKQLKATTKSAKDKYLFGNVWKAAHQYYWEKYGASKKKTWEDHEDSFNRLFTPKFTQKDIREINADDLYKDIADHIVDTSMTPSNLTAFLAILNEAFKYAIKFYSEYPDFHRNPLDVMDKTDKELLQDISYNYYTTKLPEEYMFSFEEITRIVEEAERRGNMTQFHGYYIHEYLVKAQRDLGCRPAELVALKWTDMRTDPQTGKKYFWIHAFQRDNRNGTFSYIPRLKNEKKKKKRDGRFFPICERLELLITELKKLQDSLGIESDYIFCNNTGRWVYAKDYEKVLNSICKKIGITSRGSYGFRQALNNEFEIEGMPDAAKGAVMGNSPDTNRTYYCHAEEIYCKDARKIIESRNAREELLKTKQIVASSHAAHTSNVVNFEKRKSS